LQSYTDARHDKDIAMHQYSLFDHFCLFAFIAMCRLTGLIYRLGLPPFCVNLPGLLTPNAIRFRGSNLYLLHFSGQLAR
jgi:hypothetical protein